MSGNSIDAGHDPQITRPALEHWQQIVAAGAARPTRSSRRCSRRCTTCPRHCSLVGSDEVWLSDSTWLAERMAAAGSSAAVEIYDGMWHVWPMYGAFPEAVEALKRIALFVSPSS